jgi:hypothetical protein
MAEILRPGSGSRECFGMIFTASWIQRLAETNSIGPETRFYFKLSRSSRSFATTLAALPSISEIPFLDAQVPDVFVRL